MAKKMTTLEKYKAERRERRKKIWKQIMKVALIVLIAALIVGNIVFLSIFFSNYEAKKPQVIEKEVIRYVDREVRVEVPTEIIKEVRVEVPTEVIKEIEVIKELRVEVPITKEVIKEVYVSLKKVPKSWEPVSGQTAMNLALETFGNIRIKLLFAEGSVPTLAEVKEFITEKPSYLSLWAWIAQAEECRNWPTGMTTPNSGGWGYEVFLARNTQNSLRYYYLNELGEPVLVNSSWLKNNDIYWLFIDTPTLRR